MEFGAGRKRGRPEGSFNGYGNGSENGRAKNPRPEKESFTTGLGSKMKPCTKFFSTSGCSFGDGCHFAHHILGGIKAASQLINLPLNPPLPPSFPDGSSPQSLKTRLCTKYNSPEGCKFGDKCRFAHGDFELGKSARPSYEDIHSTGPTFGRAGPPANGPAASFGSSATAKISVDMSLAGAIIGKNGVNTKQICLSTGVKLAIREHESDPNLRNIELEGTFDQIKQASAMVHELTVYVGSGQGHPTKHSGNVSSGLAENFKTKICKSFALGSCNFGERCRFAHGDAELRSKISGRNVNGYHYMDPTPPSALLLAWRHLYLQFTYALDHGGSRWCRMDAGRTHLSSEAGDGTAWVLMECIL